VSLNSSCADSDGGPARVSRACTERGVTRPSSQTPRPSALVGRWSLRGGALAPLRAVVQADTQSLGELAPAWPRMRGHTMMRADACP
jgi:hypothetical protein